MSDQLRREICHEHGLVVDDGGECVLCRRQVERTPWGTMAVLAAIIAGLFMWHHENAAQLQLASHFQLPSLVIIIEHAADEEVEVEVETDTVTETYRAEIEPANTYVDVVPSELAAEHAAHRSAAGGGARRPEHVVLIVPRPLPAPRRRATSNPPQRAVHNPGGGLSRRRPIPVRWRQPTHSSEIATTSRRRRTPVARASGGGATSGRAGGSRRSRTGGAGPRRLR